MKIRKYFLIILFPLALGLLLFIGCSKESVTGPGNQEANLSITQGIPADQINWISWKPEVKEQIDALAKSGFTGKMITQSGGTVGGNMTFGNKVEIPAGAVPSNTYITVEVLCVEDDEQCGNGIEFLPSMQFLSDITITLSWAYLDIDDISGSDIYFSENSGSTWFLTENIEFDYQNETISFYIDHFTRFAWGF